MSDKDIIRQLESIIFQQEMEINVLMEEVKNLKDQMKYLLESKPRF